MAALALGGVLLGGDPLLAVRSVDHGDALFADFARFYLPFGERLLVGEIEHVPGGTLTPGMAVAMAGLAASGRPWELYVGATVLALLASLGLIVALRRELRSGAAEVPAWPAAWLGVAFFGMVPTLHALKWGQSSTFATCLALAAGLAIVRRRIGLAALLLGLAMTCKPWAVLAVAALPSWRSRLAACGSGALLALGLPALWLGPAATLDLASALVHDVRRMLDQFAVDPNSQSVVHVAERWLRVPAGARAGLDVWLLPVGQLAALGWFAWVARARAGAVDAVPLALCGVPLLVPSAWPNDLQFAFAGLVLVAPRAEDRISTWSCRTALGLLAVPWVWLLGWRWYGGLGLPCAAVVCLAWAATRINAGVRATR